MSRENPIATVTQLHAMDAWVKSYRHTAAFQDADDLEDKFIAFFRVRNSIQIFRQLYEHYQVEPVEPRTPRPFLIFDDE